MDIFIMTDQPVTCPLCGARAEIIHEFKANDLQTQLCKCPEKDCQYLFPVFIYRTGGCIFRNNQ
jgi:hypothetical protein